MLARTAPVGHPLWVRQVSDPTDDGSSATATATTTATATATSTTRGATATASGTSASSTLTTSTSGSSTSLSTSTSSASTATATATTSSTSTTSSSSNTSTSPTSTSTSSTTSTSTSVFSTPTLLTSSSTSVSGTSTINVVITRTALAPATTTLLRPTSASSKSSSNDHGALIGGVVGGVLGGLFLLALAACICITASRRRARTGHAYFLCFGTRPFRSEKGELGHSGGAWPTFDPNSDHSGANFGAGAAAGGVGTAASSRRRRRQPQTHATLPPGFAEEDPEALDQPASSAGHGGYAGYSQNHDAYNAGYSQVHSGGHEMAESMTPGAYYGSTASRSRSSNNAHTYGSKDALSAGHMSSSAAHSSDPPLPPVPWTLPMVGSWTGDRGPYSAAGVGRGPQAFHMMGPGEGGRPRDSGPDYSHFDPPEVRDARARQAAAAALTDGRSYSGGQQSHPQALTPGASTLPRQSSQRLSSNQDGSPPLENGAAAVPSAYVDVNGDPEDNDDGLGDEAPRRLHLTNAEPDSTDDESMQNGASRWQKDPPPAGTHRAD